MNGNCIMKSNMNFTLLVFIILFLMPQASKADFEGNYSSHQWYESNIQDGLGSLTTLPMTINATENIAGDRLSVTYEDPTTGGPVLLPEFHIQGSMAAPPLRNVDYGFGARNVDMLFISDGAHMAFASVDQEFANPLDISFSTGAWQRNLTNPNPGINSLLGSWDVTIFSDPNLRDTTNGFTTELRNINITQASSDTILVPFQSDLVTLQVGGSRAWLPGGPVSLDDGILHAMDVAFDETGFSFTFIMTELYDESDVSITMGYTSSVPVPGALILFGSGLLGLIGINRKKK